MEFYVNKILVLPETDQDKSTIHFADLLCGDSDPDYHLPFQYGDTSSCS